MEKEPKQNSKTIDYNGTFGELRARLNDHKADLVSILSFVDKLNSLDSERTKDEIIPYIIRSSISSQLKQEETRDLNKLLEDINKYTALLDSLELWVLFDGVAVEYSELSDEGVEFLKKVKASLRLSDGMDPEEIQELIDKVDLNNLKDVRLSLNSVLDINTYAPLFSFLTHFSIDYVGTPARIGVRNDIDFERLVSLSIREDLYSGLLRELSDVEFGQVRYIDLKCNGLDSEIIMNFLRKNPKLETIILSTEKDFKEEIILEDADLPNVSYLFIKGRIGNIPAIVNSHNIKVFHFGNVNGEDISVPLGDEEVLNMIQEGYLDKVTSLTIGDGYLTDESFESILKYLLELRELILDGNEIDLEQIDFEIFDSDSSVETLDISGNYISEDMLEKFRKTPFASNLETLEDSDQNE